MKTLIIQLTLLIPISLVAQKTPNTPKDFNSYKDLARVSRHAANSEGFAKQNNNKEYVEVFTKYAKEDNVHALNMLAQTYQYGRKGLEVNKEKAIELYTKAGKIGYSNSWFHLGQMFRAVPRKYQEYNRAFEYYKLGANLDNNLCTYYAGYLLYKGLGCKQNYAAAAQYFIKGSVLNEMECMYYLGLCYKKGQGVLQNTDSATKWLGNAASKGHVLAQLELSKIGKEQNQKEVQSFTTFKKVENSLITKNFSITYNGVLLTFDWSGKYLVKQQNIQIEVNNNNGNISGYIKLQNDTAKYCFTQSLQNKEFVFETVKDNNVVLQENAQKVILENIKLSLTSENVLEGNITSYAVKNYNETFNPQYFIAYSNSKSKNYFVDNQKQSQLVYPNPFNSCFVVNLKTDKKVTLFITLTNVLGNIITHKKLVTTQAGLQSIPINVQEVAAGTYFLTLQYPNYLQTTKVIKQ